MPPATSEKGRYHLKSHTFLNHSELLSYEELLRLVPLCVSLGMNKIRLTGGEPLVRKNILEFIEKLAQVEGLEQIRLTTNGLLLGNYLKDLRRLGIRHINVSLDTLQREKYQSITGKDRFADVWKSLCDAEDQGFAIKINVVAMKGVNDDEFVDFARLSLNHHFTVRFIEFMPVGGKDSWTSQRFIATDAIKSMVNGLGSLASLANRGSAGPARIYELTSGDGQTGKVGFISPISHHFCDKCNRLRLTSEGKLRACLLRDTETDLRELIRNGATDKEIVEAIRTTILNKPEGHCLVDEPALQKQAGCSGKMSKIGG